MSDSSSYWDGYLTGLLAMVLAFWLNRRDLCKTFCGKPDEENRVDSPGGPSTD